MPALSLGYFGPRRPPPLFDPATTASVVGRIPESFRRPPGSTRSLHPTHSIAGIGPRADELLSDHEHSWTPCGRESPWGRIAHNRGKVLMLGVGTAACTLSHGPEEEAEPDARCGPPTPCRIVLPGQGGDVLAAFSTDHCHGGVSDRRGMARVLRERGLTSEGRVPGTAATLIDARGLWEVSLEPALCSTLRPCGRRTCTVAARCRTGATPSLTGPSAQSHRRLLECGARPCKSHSRRLLEGSPTAWRNASVSTTKGSTFSSSARSASRRSQPS